MTAEIQTIFLLFITAELAAVLGLLASIRDKMKKDDED
jgi:hypothetical protein